jgi:hypothetical protein
MMARRYGVAWGDLMNALQVFPKMIALLALSGCIAAYQYRQRKGIAEHYCVI